MAINARDILLVVRAKDEASRVIRGIGPAFGSVGDDATRNAGKMLAAGAALATAGAGMAAVGIAITREVGSWTAAAVEYQRQAALTLTQIDKIGVSLATISEIGKRVASEVPVPFEQVQQGLYDIFSSMEVSVADAETILKGFSKGAVAGQVDLQSAGRATIAILNGFGLSSDDINRVMDVQFQLVRKGVGTYEEFASSIGLGIPAASRAGQTIESLSGMIAFLTRNGLSASRAATSAGRALETMSNPKVVAKLKAMGVDILDNAGNFKQIDDIVQEFGKSLEGLTDPQRAAVLNDIFKGAGNNIQARRFWDTALKNYDSLNGLVDDMSNSAGALEAAYDIMFAQPATKAQLLKNNLDILKVSLGEALLPAFLKATEQVTKFVQWLNELSPATKKTIAVVAAITGVALTVIGIITLVAGLILIIGGAITMLGGFAAVATIGVVIAAVAAAIGAAAYVIYRNWDTLKGWWEELWPEIQKTASAVWQWMQKTWDELWPKIRKTASDVWQWLQETWDKVTKAFVKAWEVTQNVWDSVVEAFLWVKEKAGEVYQWFVSTFGPGFSRVWESIKENVGPIISSIGTIFGQMADFIVWAFDKVRSATTDLWGWIWPFIQPVLDVLWQAVTTVFPIIVGVIEAAFELAKSLVEAGWNFITRVFSAALDIIRGYLGIWAAIFSGDWEKLWDNVLKILEGAWKLVTAAFALAWDWIVAGWNLFVDLLKVGADNLWAVIQLVASWLMEFFINLPGRILGWLGSLVTLLWQKGWDLLNGLWNGIRWVWSSLDNWFKTLGSLALAAIGVMLTTLWQTGKDLLDGLWRGAKFIWQWFKAWISNLPGNIITAIGDISRTLYNIGKSIIGGMWDGMKDAFKGVGSWLGSLPGKIIAKKGPPAYDKVFLIQNGEFIMQGLLKGLQIGWLENEKFLKSITPSITGMTSPFATAGVSANAPTSTGAVSADRSINIAEGAIRIDLSGQAITEQDVRVIVNGTLREVLQEI